MLWSAGVVGRTWKGGVEHVCELSAVTQPEKNKKESRALVTTTALVPPSFLAEVASC